MACWSIRSDFQFFILSATKTPPWSTLHAPLNDWGIAPETTNRPDASFAVTTGDTLVSTPFITAVPLLEIEWDETEQSIQSFGRVVAEAYPCISPLVSNGLFVGFFPDWLLEDALSTASPIDKTVPNTLRTSEPPATAREDQDPDNNANAIAKHKPFLPINPPVGDLPQFHDKPVFLVDRPKPSRDYRMMKRPILLLLSFAFVDMALASCPRPGVSFSVDFKPPVVDHSESAITVSRMRGKGFFPQASVTLGLFKPNASLGMRTHFATFQGSSCVSRVDVTYSAAPTIIVAREIPEGSCSWNEVLTHERRHWNAQRDAAIATKAKVSEIVTGIMSARIPSSDPSISSGMLQQLQGAAAEKIEEAIESAAAYQHSNIDSPFEYDRVSLSCNGQLQQVMRGMWGTHITR